MVDALTVENDERIPIILETCQSFFTPWKEQISFINERMKRGYSSNIIID
jgi:hypothetical protein